MAAADRRRGPSRLIRSVPDAAADDLRGSGNAPGDGRGRARRAPLTCPDGRPTRIGSAGSRADRGARHPAMTARVSGGLRHAEPRRGHFRAPWLWSNAAGPVVARSGVCPFPGTRCTSCRSSSRPPSEGVRLATGPDHYRLAGELLAPMGR